MNNINKTLSINETYILEPIEGSDIYSACTGFYTNSIISCSGNTAILLGTNLIIVDGPLSATTFYGDGSNLTGISTQDTFVTGGTYDVNTGIAQFTNNTGGTFSVSGFYTGYTPQIDVTVTGGTYSAGTAVFTNNTGGTFSVSGFSTSTGTDFTGGTVSGATNFTGGLTANTISATTYLGLPLDVYTTGATYSNNQLFFDRNNGLSAYTVQLSGLSQYYYPLSGNPSNFLTNDEVETYSGVTAFPSTGQTGVIYIAEDTGLGYTWNGSSYVNIAATGIAGLGTPNFLPKFLSANTITNSRFVDTGGGGGRYGELTGSYVGFITGGNRWLTLNRAQSNMQFVLGNPGFSQPNIIYSNNTIDGFQIMSNGILSLYGGSTLEGSTIESFRILTSGRLNIPQSPSAGTISDLILVRDVSGNVKTISASIISTPFTGGTVSGATIFNNGLSANTFSATTYLGLPLDVYTTGGTYSNGTALFTNNTGGIFSVTGFSTGYTLTSSGITSVLGYTPLSGYTDITITGGTYSGGVATYTNNTGGTFNVSGFSNNENVVSILESSPNNQFALAHGTCVINDKIYIGTRQGADSKLLRYSGLTLEEVITIPCTTGIGIESLCFKSDGTRLFGTRYNLGVSYIFDVNPEDFTDINYNIITGTTLGGSPAIVTDDTFIYCVNQTTDAEFSKIQISDFSTVLTNTWVGVGQGHSGVINTTEGVAYFGSQTGYLAKVQLSDLTYVDIDLTDYITLMTDDMAFVPNIAWNDFTNRVIVGSEVRTDFSGRGGVLVDVDNMTAIEFDLLPSYGLFTKPDYTKVYNVSNVGFVEEIDIALFELNLLSFNQTFYTNTYTYRGDGVPNELFFTTAGIYLTNWGATGNLHKIELNPVIRPVITSTESFYRNLNIPTNLDIFVTGGTYSAGTALFTNNTGGTFSVTGFSQAAGSSFTGGTVSGATNFTGGLTANTFSAVTISTINGDVQTQLNSKLNISAATATGVTLVFTTDTVYGGVNVETATAITANVSGALLGVTNLLIHSGTSTPSFSSEFRRLSGSGSYSAGTTNYIFCTYLAPTNIIYSINQLI